MSQINAQTVDFGASDTPMLDTELAPRRAARSCTSRWRSARWSPPTTSRASRPASSSTATRIGKIYAGKITNWNDPALIKALNPGTNLPDEPIAVVHRSDGSGTTAVLTDFLTKDEPDLGGKPRRADKSFGKTVAWPVGIGGKGNDGVSALVSQTEGADRLRRAAVRDLAAS